MNNFFGNKSTLKSKETYDDIEFEKREKKFNLGEYNTFHLLSDPKRVGFMFSRYKFVSKMFDGFDNVLEIGCQEGLGSLIVSKAVGKLVATDYYIPHIESCIENVKDNVNNIEFRGHDIIDGPINENFKGVFSLDVFEHIDPLQEDVYMYNIAKSLQEHGVFILGTPSLESQKYASETSKKGHINCKTGKQLKDLCEKYYHNVFMFGMNDEVVHTGFLPMAHYLFAVCVSPKR